MVSSRDAYHRSQFEDLLRTGNDERRGRQPYGSRDPVLLDCFAFVSNASQLHSLTLSALHDLQWPLIWKTTIIVLGAP